MFELELPVQCDFTQAKRLSFLISDLCLIVSHLFLVLSDVVLTKILTNNIR